MSHSENFYEGHEKRFIKIENISNQIFNSLVEVDPSEEPCQRKRSRPVSILLEIVGIEETESSPQQPQKRVLSRIVPRNEIDGEMTVPGQNPGQSARLIAGPSCHDAGSQAPIAPTESKPCNIERQRYEEVETMAAIRKVMVAQKRELNLRNLPDLLSPEEFELEASGNWFEGDTSEAADMDIKKTPNSFFTRWKQTPALKHLCSWKAAALALVVLALPSLAASTVSLAVVVVLALLVAFGPEHLFDLFNSARRQT